MFRKTIIRKILFCFFTLIGLAAVFLIAFSQEQVLDRVLSDISKFEFKFLALLSPYLSQKPDILGPQLILGSHRGVVEAGGVDNSRQSIEEAIKKGYRYLEVDISFSSDLKPYVFHGPELELVALTGRFPDYSSQQVEQFRLKNGQPIISLEEFCALYLKSYKGVYLDIKGSDSNHKQKAKMLCKAIGNFESDRVALIGLPWRVIRAVKNTLPEVAVGFEQKGAIVNYLLGADLVSLYYKYEFSYAEYKLTKLLGLDVLIWTINDVQIVKELSKIYRVTILTDLKNPQELTHTGLIWH